MSVDGDSVHLDLVLAADAEIDRQLDLIPSDCPIESVMWTKDSACPRGAFEVRALQRGFRAWRAQVSQEPVVFETTFYRRAR